MAEPEQPEIQILESAQDHAQILSEMLNLEFADSALKQCEENLTEVKKDREQRQAKVAQLEKLTKTEYKEWRNIENSTTTRLLERVRHKGKKEAIEERREKEEREYLAAFENERDERLAVGKLDGQITSLGETIADLKQKQARHSQLRDQINHLYSRVFDGPTPAFPEEDEAEEKLQSAENDYQQFEGRINLESNTLNSLLRARQSLVQALKAVSTALSYSGYDMFSRGSFADYLERSALADAKGFAVQGQMMWQQACRSNPQVPPVPVISIASGNFLGDILFDNIFSDYAFHQKIQASEQNVRAVANLCARACNEAEARLKAIKQSHARSLSKVRSARVHLDSVRRRIFLDAATTVTASYREEPEEIEIDSSMVNRSASGRATANLNPYADAMLSAARRDTASSDNFPDLPAYDTAPPPGYSERDRS